MTPPSEPLWGFSIPLTPTDKVFRVTHRSTTLRGAIAWDTSYMSTVSLEGRGDSIAKLLRSLGVGKSEQDGAIWGDAGVRWRRGTRTWRGWLHGRDSYPLCPISPATVTWSAEGLPNPPDSSQKTNETRPQQVSKRTVFVRCHPSAFVRLWQLLLQLSKVQKPSITIHDLRYEIGSLEVTGPNSMEALVNVLRPVADTKDDCEKRAVAKSVWDKLALITNPSFLPKNVLIAFDAIDPRLRPSDRIKADLTQMPQVIDMCSRWPLDDLRGSISLFDRTLRTKSNSSVASEKTINRKLDKKELDKSAKSSSGATAIPLVLFPTQQGRSIQSSWVVLLPWSRVKSVWQSLMHCPLSCGSTVRFGGISEAHQAAYESGSAWFPADYPGTEAGFQWELQERKKSEAEWRRKPKGRRVEYETLDLGAGQKGEVGRGWACDWEILVAMKSGNLSAFHSCGLTSPDVEPERPPLSQLPASVCLSSDLPEHATGLVAVKITMITQGVPLRQARIYRLPDSNIELKQKWIAMAQKSKVRGYPDESCD
jgi:ribonuclease P/MRP protein subunit POP1